MLVWWKPIGVFKHTLILLKIGTTISIYVWKVYAVILCYKNILTSLISCMIQKRPFVDRDCLVPSKILETSLIPCDAFNARSMTNRKYHYLHSQVIAKWQSIIFIDRYLSQAYLLMCSLTTNVLEVFM